MQTSGNSAAANVSFISICKQIDHIGWLDQQISIDHFLLKLTVFYYSFKKANMEANLFLSILG